MVATGEMWSPETDYSGNTQTMDSADFSYNPNKAYMYYNLPKWFNQFTSDHRKVMQQDALTTLLKDTTFIS
jgi:hypothetical protein